MTPCGGEVLGIVKIARAPSEGASLRPSFRVGGPHTPMGCSSVHGTDFTTGVTARRDEKGRLARQAGQGMLER